VPIARELAGKTKFKLGSPAAVSLRMEMKDQAGNAGTTQKDVPAAGAPPDRITSAAAPGPHALAQAGTGGTPPALNVANNGAGNAPPSPVADNRLPPAPAPLGNPLGGNYPPAGVYPPPPNYASGQAYPAATNNAPAPAPNYPPAPGYPPYPAANPPAGGYQTGCFPPAPNYPPAGGNPPAPNPTDSATHVVAWSPNSDPGVAGQGGLPSAAPARGPAPNVLVVNDPQVTLEYDMKAGPSGLSKVELWLTEDEGRTWRPYAEDEDKKSPITVKLPGQGLFGVRLVTTSGAGFSEGPPQPGDPPDLRIEVDTTPPLVQLFEPKADPQRPDALLLSWNAADRNLAPRPVTLEYAEPRGPWVTIATAQAASGSLSWQLPKPMSHVQLRVTAIDMAGNRSVAETREPVPCDYNKPRGRIIGLAQPASKHAFNDSRSGFSDRPILQPSPLGGNQ
jgi:hypothetical protein